MDLNTKSQPPGEKDVKLAILQAERDALQAKVNRLEKELVEKFKELLGIPEDKFIENLKSSQNKK